MKIFVYTIIGTLLCCASGNCQQRTISIDCYFGLPPGVNLDNLGEKKKFPIDYCKLANFDQYLHLLQLEISFIKPNEKKACIKIIDFVKSKKKRPIIPLVVEMHAFNDATYRTITTRLAVLQANANAAFRQKVNGKNKPEPPKENRPVILPQTFL